MTRFLIHHGAKIDAPNVYGATALHCATQSVVLGSVDIMKYLISQGASVNMTGENGMTPLLYAAADKKKLHLLIEAGADITARCHSDLKLLHHIALASVTNGGRTVQIWASLVQRGLDPFSEGLGITPVHCAMNVGSFTSLLLNGDFRLESLSYFPLESLYNLPSIKWLDEAFHLYRRRIPAENLFSVLSTPDSLWDISPLCNAARVRGTRVITNVLSAGVSIDHEGCPTGSALMVACEYGRLDCVKVLVRHGAHLHYHGQSGARSAVSLARPYKEIVRWLLVVRHTEQPKLQNEAFSSEQPSIGFWSGTQKRKFWTDEHEQQYQEPLVEYVVRLQRLKRNMRGKVVRPPPTRIRQDPQYPDFHINFDRFINDSEPVPHCNMNLKESVEDWTRQYYVPKFVVLRKLTDRH